MKRFLVLVLTPLVLFSTILTTRIAIAEENVGEEITIETSETSDQVLSEAEVDAKEESAIEYFSVDAVKPEVAEVALSETEAKDESNLPSWLGYFVYSLDTSSKTIQLTKCNSGEVEEIVIESPVIIDEEEYQIVLSERLFSICRANSLSIYGNVRFPDDCSSMFASGIYGCHEIVINVDDISNVTNMTSMFANDYLTSLDLVNFDTSNVTSMRGMFAGSNLTSMDLSSFDTSNVTDMKNMFSNCSHLISLDLSSFDTSNVTDMSYMFNACNNLTSMDLSSFDTLNVTDMNNMFNSCSNLTSIDLSSFDTSKVTNMSDMFVSCIKLNELDLQSFNTSNVIYMHRMFKDCSNLVSLDVSSFDVSKAQYTYYMFANCSRLEELDVSNFITTNVRSMHYMFSGCESLREIDICNFRVVNTAYMNAMFKGCTSLQTIYGTRDLGKEIRWGLYEDSSDMFADCPNLVGQNGTYAEDMGDYFGVEAAKVDEEGSPGLFTEPGNYLNHDLVYAVLNNDGGIHFHSCF